MSFKTLLCVVGVDHGSDDLVAAAELAQRWGVHLKAIVVSSVPPPPIDDLEPKIFSTWSFAWQEENQRVHERAQTLAKLLRDKGLRGDVRAVYCIEGNVDDEVAEQALYVDVSVIGAGMLKDRVLLRRVLDGALFQSPTPVILVPDGKANALAPKTVVIAWNAKPEAGAAVRAAMDMLVAAESVHVVLVDPDATSIAAGEEPGADVATFLTRHGVRTTVDVLPSGGREISAVLQRYANDIAADLVVMGAYGHSRLRERIFGGTTQAMIENAGIAVFMAR